MDATLGDTLDEAHHTAVKAVALARKLLGQRSPGDFVATQKSVTGDLVTDIDYRAELIMMELIHSAFPNHRITSEEGGAVDGAAEWTWLIDPLDGTNNVVLGIPLYGSCVTLIHNGEAVVAAIYVAHEDATYSAVRGKGALRNGKPIRIRHDGAPQLATISWINGYGVTPADAVARRALGLLERRFKRTLSLWAPSVDWSLLVRGQTGALLAYQNEPEDLLCGVLIAAEAEAVVMDFSGREVRDVYATGTLVVAAPEMANYMAKVLGELSDTS
jgi:myo-inositol-1(or 4)-monophosphatase